MKPLCADCEAKPLIVDRTLVMECHCSGFTPLGHYEMDKYLAWMDLVQKHRAKLKARAASA